MVNQKVAARLQVGPNCLLFFIDETGHETFADKNYPVAVKMFRCMPMNFSTQQLLKTTAGRPADACGLTRCGRAPASILRLIRGFDLLHDYSHVGTPVNHSPIDCGAVEISDR